MTAACTRPPKTERIPIPMNGVDTPALLATINAIGAQPELARFRFRARSEWITGTHCRTTMHDFHGAGAEQAHAMAYQADGDHPAVLCGADKGPSPVEWVLHALASCLTSGMANIAAARGVKLRHVSMLIEGDIDLRGMLGLSVHPRNGYQGIRVRVDIDGEAAREELEQIVMQAKARSAVYDIITKGVPVAIATS